MKTQFDVIIVGGGMVGSSLACALGQAGIDTLLLDEISPSMSWPPADYELRVSAITAKSQRFLQDIVAWEGVAARRISPFREMRVWDATGDGKIHFDSAEIGAPALGHIVENLALQQALVERLQTFSNVVYQHPVRLRELQLQTERATLITDRGEALQARLLVGADGARSWLRARYDIETIGWSYQQKGVVCTVRTEHSHQETAWQRFLPTGPVAFLPLNDGRCSIVWSTTESEADHLVALIEDEFLAQLNLALGESPLGRVLSCGKRAAFPLRLQHSARYIDHRLALIGDAAHTIHPLAGQGVNLGFADALELAQLLVNAKGSDLGNSVLLRRYERARKGDNLAMMGIMDGFKRLFSNKHNIPRVVRNLGLTLTNQASPLKNTIVRYAMGLDTPAR